MDSCILTELVRFMVKIKLTSNCCKRVCSAQRSFYSVSGPPLSLSFFALKNKEVMGRGEGNLKFLGNGSGPHSVWSNGGELRAKGAGLPSVGCEDWTAHLHCFLDKHKGDLPFFSLKISLMVLFLLNYNNTICSLTPLVPPPFQKHGLLLIKYCHTYI